MVSYCFRVKVLPILVIWKNGLESLFPKFITSWTGKQIITIYILSSTSRSKGYYTIKFVKLIENNTRSIFLEKSCKKFGITIENIFGSTVWKLILFVLFVHVKCWPLGFISYEAFLKHKSFLSCMIFPLLLIVANNDLRIPKLSLKEHHNSKHITEPFNYLW